MNFKKLTGATFAASLLLSTAAYADITIGLIAPLTGPVAAYGDQVKKGAEAAVAEINKSGGILGEQVVLKLAPGPRLSITNCRVRPHIDIFILKRD